MCGEKKHGKIHIFPLVGSPPRVQGKACGVAGDRPLYGITPACAGKSPRVPASEILRGDHPRVCGEKYFVTLPGFSVAGSPPRVRGKVTKMVHGAKTRGITPACAGKSAAVFFPCVYHGDHPRVCGEKAVDCGSDRPCQGSPPRVRGKARCARSVRLCMRITPACAGKSDRSGDIVNNRKGSPPRVRGKVCAESMVVPPAGITPACAGKRKSCTIRGSLARDHPRVCGEKTLLFARSQTMTGSPPRVRGKVHADVLRRFDQGITPACAGKRQIR